MYCRRCWRYGAAALVLCRRRYNGGGRWWLVPWTGCWRRLWSLSGGFVNLRHRWNVDPLKCIIWILCSGNVAFRIATLLLIVNINITEKWLVYKVIKKNKKKSRTYRLHNYGWMKGFTMEIICFWLIKIMYVLKTMHIYAGQPWSLTWKILTEKYKQLPRSLLFGYISKLTNTQQHSAI